MPLVGIMPEQSEWFLKLGLCLAPMVAGCLGAFFFAERSRMEFARRAWKCLAGIFLAAIGTVLLAGLVIWAIA